MSSLGLGIAAAGLASVLYNGAVSLQASEARTSSPGLGFRAKLMQEMAHRPRWLGGLLLAIAAAPIQVVALMLAPLTVVQPTLAVGLLLLLAIGKGPLGERVRKRELACVVAIIGGIAGLAWVAPPHTTEHAGLEQLLLALGLCAGLASLPLALSFSRYRGRAVGYLAAIGAGLWYACGSFCAKLISDDLSGGAWPFVGAWALATALAAIIGLLSENTALQGRPASRVSPVVFVVEMLIPVVFAPVLTAERWSADPVHLAVLIGSLSLVLVATVLLTSSDKIIAIAQPVH